MRTWGWHATDHVVKMLGTECTYRWKEILCNQKHVLTSARNLLSQDAHAKLRQTCTVIADIMTQMNEKIFIMVFLYTVSRVLLFLFFFF